MLKHNHKTLAVICIAVYLVLFSGYCQFVVGVHWSEFAQWFVGITLFTSGIIWELFTGDILMPWKNEELPEEVQAEV